MQTNLKSGGQHSCQPQIHKPLFDDITILGSFFVQVIAPEDWPFNAF